MTKTAKLLLHCPDQPGILAAVTDFITVNKGNIACGKHFFHAFGMGIGELSYSARED